MLRKAYRELALQHHPDRNPSGTERMALINVAYSVLSDPEQRRVYDRAHKFDVAPGCAKCGGAGVALRRKGWSGAHYNIPCAECVR